MSGVIVTDEAAPSPIRRARVTLRAQALNQGWTATTDDQGRFVLPGVAAGRHTLEASKPAWLTTSYGAARPGRPGTPIVVADGARLEGITLRMRRAGSITGTVVDRSGQPVPGVGVSALSYSFSQVTGERTLGRHSIWASVTTDDEGNYRAFGLPPGEYVVVATLRLGSPTALVDLRRIAEGDVDRIAAQTRGFATAPGAMGGADSSPLVGFAPMYFPGTADPSRAVTVMLGVGEDRPGVNITLDPVPTSKVTVAATLGEGLNPASLQVYLLPSNAVVEGAPSMLAGRRGPDGFEFSGVTPGAYTVVARAGGGGAAAVGRGSAGPLTHYATADVVVDGANVSVPLELRPGVTVRGRLVFLGESPVVPKEVAGARVHLMPVQFGAALSVPAAAVDASAAFAFAGVPPGRYRFAYSRSGGFEAWSLKSVAIGGRVLDDFFVEIVSGQTVLDLVLNFTDRPSELAGRLETATGRPAPDFYIVAFSTNPAYWSPLSRYVAQVRPGTDGRFSVRGLPAGEYYLAALTDVETGEWYDPRFLNALVPASVKVVVRDGEQTTQDLRIR